MCSKPDVNFYNKGTRIWTKSKSIFLSLFSPETSFRHYSESVCLEIIKTP